MSRFNVTGLPPPRQEQGVLRLLDQDGAGDDLLAGDVELLAIEGQLAHVEADLLHDLVAQQHVGAAGPLVLDLVEPILVPLGPAVDRRLKLEAEVLDAGRGVEPEQGGVVRADARFAL